MQFQIHNHHQECNEKTKIWDFSQNNFFFFDIFSVEVSLAFVIWTWLNFLNVFTKFQWWILGESTFDIIIFTITTTFNLFIKKIVSDHGREKFPKRLRRSCYQNHSQGLRAPSHHAHGHSLQGGGGSAISVVQEYCDYIVGIFKRFSEKREGQVIRCIIIYIRKKVTWRFSSVLSIQRNNNLVKNIKKRHN